MIITFTVHHQNGLTARGCGVATHRRDGRVFVRPTELVLFEPDGTALSWSPQLETIVLLESEVTELRMTA